MKKFIVCTILLLVSFRSFAEVDLSEGQVNAIKKTLASKYIHLSDAEVKNPTSVIDLKEKTTCHDFMKTSSRVGYDGYSRLESLIFFGRQLKEVTVRDICVFSNGELVNMEASHSMKSGSRGIGSVYNLQEGYSDLLVLCYAGNDYMF
ncbi:MAG: hypothetical protein HQK50_01015 [Oligoflexia bacterium]|nr:hypothetical protein [Oligoflexia bacterium]